MWRALKLVIISFNEWENNMAISLDELEAFQRHEEIEDAYEQAAQIREAQVRYESNQAWEEREVLRPLAEDLAAGLDQPGLIK